MFYILGTVKSSFQVKSKQISIKKYLLDKRVTKLKTVAKIFLRASITLKVTTKWRDVLWVNCPFKLKGN